MAPNDIVVSKTDTKGRITYANQTFLDIAGYTEKEVIGRPHNIVRHPEMPRAVFKLLWDTILDGREVFAYVVNRAKNGDHYWVFAHVTPTFFRDGSIVNFHSSRRAPRREAIEAVRSVYGALLEEEAKCKDPKSAAVAGAALLTQKFIGTGNSYEDFVFSI